MLRTSQGRVSDDDLADRGALSGLSMIHDVTLRQHHDHDHVRMWSQAADEGSTPLFASFDPLGATGQYFGRPVRLVPLLRKLILERGIQSGPARPSRRLDAPSGVVAVKDQCWRCFWRVGFRPRPLGEL